MSSSRSLSLLPFITFFPFSFRHLPCLSIFQQPVHQQRARHLQASEQEEPDLAREDPSGNEPTEEFSSDEVDSGDDEPHPHAKPAAPTQAVAAAKPVQGQAVAVLQPPTQPRGRAAGEPRAGTMAWEGAVRHAEIQQADSNGKDVHVKRARPRSPTKSSLNGSGEAEVDTSGAPQRARPRGRGADEPRAGMLGRLSDERTARPALVEELLDQDLPVKRARRQSPEQAGATAKGNGLLSAAARPRGRSGADPALESGLDPDPRGGLVSRRSGEGARAQAGLQGINSQEDAPGLAAQPRGRGALEPRSGLMGWDPLQGESRQGAATQRPVQQVAQRKSMPSGNLFRSAVIGAAQQ